MALTITAMYAAVFGLFAIGLSTAVSIMRGKTGISILHGDDMALAERMRRFGNFIETVPLALILMAACELNSASSTWLHAIGGLLLAGRILHAFGLSHSDPKAVLRIFGGVASKVSMIIAIVYIAKSCL